MQTAHDSCIYPGPSTKNFFMNQCAALLLLAKPGIVLAEACAGMAGMLLAAPSVPPLYSSVFGILCLVLAASGASLANSVLEVRTDSNMPRLANRSLALEISGIHRVTVLSVTLITASLCISIILLSMLAALLILTAVACYLLLYTVWLKKITPWGVFAGAIPGALPPLIGSVAVSGAVSEQSMLLALVVFVWQLPHFWLLALQYADEYRQAGIPVLPVTHGPRLTKALILVSAVLLVPLPLFFGWDGSGSPYFVGTALFAGFVFAVHCFWCLYCTCNYRKGNRASLVYLLTIVMAIICDRILNWVY